MHWPFVTQRRFQRETAQLRLVALQLRQVAEARADAAIAEDRKRLDEWIPRLAEIQWERREPGVYVVSVALDARAFSLDATDEKHQEIVARFIGREIEAQIATLRFVKMAAHQRQRLYASLARSWPTGDP